VLGKILTIDNIRKRNLIVINRCCLCKADGETIDHLFFTVRLLVLFGMLFLVDLACHGSCLVRWQGCLLVGGREAGLGVLLFGKWFLYVLYGVYGCWKETRML
jgi:hypothetical protein